MKLTFGLFAMLMTIAILGCTNTQKNQEQDQEQVTSNEDLKVWDGVMDDYHEIMADAFHSSEEDNLEPLKNRATELAAKAKEWAGLAIPVSLTDPELPKKLTELEAGSRDIVDKVNSGLSDEELKKAIFDLHDVFHAIVGICDEHS